jgi:dTDP-4-dehydrorhamnose 3,5-epimerase
MEISPTLLSGVFLLQPRRFGDARGWFSETWSQARFDAAGLNHRFVQDNQSFSAKAGTVRGLHYQRPPHAQAKLVRVLRGRIFDVAVDVRQGSPTYGRWTGHELSADNGHQLLIPAGFLHGFATLEANCDVAYKVTDIYAPDCDGGIRWDDPDLAIDWHLGGLGPVLSEKDAAAPAFGTFRTPFGGEFRS